MAEKIAAKFGGTILDPAAVKLPLEQHLIVIGARENNPLIARLYRRGFCYTDRTYPGAGGYELRSIHNPTGGGFNVLLAGGSDDAGIEAAAATGAGWRPHRLSDATVRARVRPAR